MAARVLPMYASQFVPNHMPYGNDVFLGMREDFIRLCWLIDSGADFETLQTGHSSHSPNTQQALLMGSPPMVHSDVSLRRQSSQSPRVTFDAAAPRDRTPIRRYRPTATRDRSHSRSEMLLARAEQNRIHESQSFASMAASHPHNASNMPQMYNMPTYNISPPMTSFLHASTIFDAPVPSRAQQEADILMYRQGAVNPQAFYPVKRTLPLDSETGLRQQPDAHNAQYAVGQAEPGQQPLSSVDNALQSFPTPTLTLESSPAELEIKPARPKPQCWDHGCNGRRFSTFSNLLRHQREKSGSATKAVCPHCGTEFTRTTARNGHMSGGKCKGKADAEASNHGHKNQEPAN